MINKFKFEENQKGVILPAVLVLTIAFSVIGFSLLSYTTSQYNLAIHNTYASNSLNMAEAGIELSLNELNEDSDFTGYATEQILFDDSAQGRGVFTSTIEDIAGSNAKTITSIGKTYRYGSDDIESTRKVKTTAVGTGSPGYSVHSGPGGLILSGSATITNSEVYAGGYVTMSGSARIGTTSMPLNVHVANKRCPTGSNPGPTYPQVCSSSQPISISGSARIYGSVCATGQTSGTGIYTGSGGQGLIPGCTAPDVTMPTFDRSSHISSMTTTSSSSNPTYQCGGSDTKTWPANLRLNGNVSIGGSCQLTINGNAYITGNLSIGGSARVRVADSLGTTRPVILADGTVNSGGSASLISNSQGTGFHFISWRSSASCNPNCTNVTGTDLYNSQSVTTVDIGGSSSLAGMIFQAMWGRARLGGSGNVGSVIGQSVDLSGSGTIIFGTSLSSGTTTWTITSYQRIFD